MLFLIYISKITDINITSILLSYIFPVLWNIFHLFCLTCIDWLSFAYRFLQIKIIFTLFGSFACQLFSSSWYLSHFIKPSYVKIWKKLIQSNLLTFIVILIFDKVNWNHLLSILLCAFKTSSPSLILYWSSKSSGVNKTMTRGRILFLFSYYFRCFHIYRVTNWDLK